MSEPENFLSRWSRRKREADAAPEPAAKPADDTLPEANTTAPVEEPVFDVASLPSLDSIGAGSDMSMFMQPGVPAALRHAALRRAWMSDPAIRDFRGLQENDWDFTAPDGVPGFGSFKSDDEIKALARRLFGDVEGAPVQNSHASQNDSEHEHASEVAASDPVLDGRQDEIGSADAAGREDNSASVAQTDGDAAVQPGSARRHGGALPQ